MVGLQGGCNGKLRKRNQVGTSKKRSRLVTVAGERIPNAFALRGLVRRFVFVMSLL
jgi:hypothetical protein